MIDAVAQQVSMDAELALLTPEVLAPVLWNSGWEGDKNNNVVIDGDTKRAKRQTKNDVGDLESISNACSDILLVFDVKMLGLIAKV